MKAPRKPSPHLARLQLLVYRARIDAGMTRAAAEAHVNRLMAFTRGRP